MSEGPPISLPAEPTWNIRALEKALGPAAAITDVVFGQGQLFRVPEGGEHTLAIYPDSRVARLATHAAEITLFDLAPPSVSERQVIVSLWEGQNPRLSGDGFIGTLLTSVYEALQSIINSTW